MPWTGLGAAGILGGLGLIGSKMSSSAMGLASSKAYRRYLYMSNTAHQREVADLRAAGINPALTASGKGASASPISKSDVPDYAKAMTSGVSTAIAYRQANANIARTDADTRSVDAQAKLDEDAVALYEQNPSVQQAVQSARLTRMTGGRAEAGAMLGGSSALGMKLDRMIGKAALSIRNYRSKKAVKKLMPVRGKSNKLHPLQAERFRRLRNYRKGKYKR